MKTDEWANSRVHLTLELEPLYKEHFICVIGWDGNW